jgi:hypothetical protein
LFLFVRVCFIKTNIFFTNFKFLFLESLTYLSMTLLGSFILTSRFLIFFYYSIKSIVYLGGVYFGFSCFDCCSRWSSRKYSSTRSILAEVSTYFLPYTIRYKFLNERNNSVRLVLTKYFQFLQFLFLAFSWVLLFN